MLHDPLEKESPVSKKWCSATPLFYSDAGHFWERESGLFCEGFRSIGHNSKLVVLGDPATPTDARVYLGSFSDLENPAFWKNLGADGVVFYSWAAPKYTKMARAIKESGAKLVLKLDSDGVKSPRVSFWLQLVRAIYSSRDRKIFPAVVYGFVHTLLSYVFPAVHDRKMISQMEFADVIGIECPVAAARLSRLLRSYTRDDLARRVAVIPHPVTDDAVYSKTTPKASRIIAVGRWDTWQKDAPLLMQVLGDALSLHPDYTAEIYGSGEDFLQRLARSVPEKIRQRIKIAGRIDHPSLVRQFQESQILFMPSRWEGFPNTASEAVCCGCSVVGAAQLSSLAYFAGRSSGTLASFRTRVHLLDALDAEIHEWRAGQRDPSHISQSFVGDLALLPVIRKTLSFFPDSSENHSAS